MEGFKHVEIRRLALDVTIDEQVADAIRQVIEEEGRIDIVVNNAGVSCPGPLIEIPLEQVRAAFDTNFYSALRMARAVIPIMATRKKGLIVNVGSVVGEICTPWNGMYSTTKAALHSLTEGLYMECKPFNIDVMLLVPGAVKSNIAANSTGGFRLPPDSLYKAYLDQIVRRMSASQAAGTMPTEDFAREVVNKVLAEKPPRYLTLGGRAWVFSLLKWLPRRWALNYFWRMFSKKS